LLGGTSIFNKVAEVAVTDPTATLDLFNVSGGNVYLFRATGLRVTPALSNNATLPIYLQLGTTGSLIQTNGAYVEGGLPYLQISPTPASAPTGVVYADGGLGKASTGREYGTVMF